MCCSSDGMSFSSVITVSALCNSVLVQLTYGIYDDLTGNSDTGLCVSVFYTLSASGNHMDFCGFGHLYMGESCLALLLTSNLYLGLGLSGGRGIYLW